MKEIWDLRINPYYAHLLFKPEEGIDLGIVRKILMDSTDPRFSRLGELENLVRRKHDNNFCISAFAKREYTKAELESARSFVLSLRPMFEPKGLDYDTQYDFSTACAECSAGYRQNSNLRILTRGLGKRDILQPFSGEIIISSRLAKILAESGFSGFEIRPILNPKSGKEASDFFQFVIADHNARISEMTRVGDYLLEPEQTGCSKGRAGHVIGQLRFSELRLMSVSKLDNDVTYTKEYLGSRQGMFLPTPEIVVSPRFRKLLLQHKVRGCKFEVAQIE